MAFIKRTLILLCLLIFQLLQILQVLLVPVFLLLLHGHLRKVGLFISHRCTGIANLSC